MLGEETAQAYVLQCSLATNAQLFGYLERDKNAKLKNAVEIVEAELRLRGLIP